jgi:hypothetical protein
LKRLIPLLLITLGGCTNPFHPPESSSSYVEPTNPKGVIENLKMAMISRDLEGYLQCLDRDSFKFYFDAQDTTVQSILKREWGLDSLYWGYTEEKLSVEVMFSIEREIYLELVELPAPPNPEPNHVNLFYEYVLNIEPPLENIAIVEGRALFTLKKNPETGYWVIETWRDYAY